VSKTRPQEESKNYQQSTNKGSERQIQTNVQKQQQALYYNSRERLEEGSPRIFAAVNI